MVIFTDFCGIPEAQYSNGWIFVGILLLFIVVSIGFILVPSFKTLFLYCVKYYKLAYRKMKEWY